MATRGEVDRRRTELSNHLRNLSQSQGLASRAIVPSVRELADKYSLSIKVVRQTLENLVTEGILYTVPRVGTFVGQRSAANTGYYLLLLPYAPIEHDQAYRTQIGFEERIAQYGGASLALVKEEALRRHHAKQMPPLAGIFDFEGNADLIWNANEENAPPLVVFADATHTRDNADAVSFDNRDGGYQAAQYLLGLGHRQIAFLALHPLDPEPGAYIWSIEREAGWRQAMREAGQSPEGLAYYCPALSSLDAGEQKDNARIGALGLTARSDVTAVVTANDNAAVGLFAALSEREVPASRWPVVVSFDNLIHASKYLLTSFNLPWEDLGSAAANLLWERQQGRLTGPTEHRRVPMRLIRRLSSQVGWSLSTPSTVFIPAGGT